MIVRKGQRLGSILHDREDEPGPEPSPEEPALTETEVEADRQAEQARQTTTDEQTSDEPKRPAQADPKDAWVDYAVTQGIDRDEAEAMTKADLVELLKES